MWLHTIENIDHVYYIILMRAWKTALGFSLVTDPRLTKYCGPLQGFL